MHRYIAAALLAFAAVVYFKPQKPFDLRAWQPLALPVDLKPGTIRTPEFTAGLDTNYLLLIERAGNNRADCLLGMPLLGGARCDVPGILDIRWTVLASSTATISASSRDYGGGFFFGGRTARKIGVFHAAKGVRYSVVLDVRRNAAELNPATFLVQTHPGDWKDAMVGHELDSILRVPVAATLAAAALITLAIGWLVRRSRKRA